ncbi:hypothetical protein E2C01_088732 [Portunus trituberculatus]|uniref:Uncharacterized protein n=1 Tax=Portunus trituberculatus TaxID=210409 RepID=A0A5B7JKM5_PORTR|nr:hypothetical protein [Portunus trituberculatus]
MWAAVEEGRFMWGQQGPPSSPDNKVRSNSEMIGRVKDLSGGWFMNVTVSVNSRDDYFSWKRAVLRRRKGGMVMKME